MIPIPLIWKTYTCTMHGSTVKIVACENCSTEYVYLMERDGVGVGTSWYWLNDDGARDRAKSAAEDLLQSALENDYDPVPCPVCGHYQRSMFPKLLEQKETRAQAAGAGVSCLLLALMVIASLNTALTLLWSIAYLLDPNDRYFRNLIVGGAILLPLCVLAVVLWFVKRAKIRRFDPNSADQQFRISIGRSLAVTRAEFEEAQQQS